MSCAGVAKFTAAELEELKRYDAEIEKASWRTVESWIHERSALEGRAQKKKCPQKPKLQRALKA
ncbi:MAG: hypothetical protein LUE11_04910 [Clostridia bacterium]|nr:hypothetical protein [Clostridia bacterium]